MYDYYSISGYTGFASIKGEITALTTILPTYDMAIEAMEEKFNTKWDDMKDKVTVLFVTGSFPYPLMERYPLDA